MFGRPEALGLGHGSGLWAGTEVHDCVQDVLMTMELALHRLRGKDVATVWVAAPCPACSACRSAPFEEQQRPGGASEALFPSHAAAGGRGKGPHAVVRMLGHLASPQQALCEDAGVYGGAAHLEGG